MSSDFPSNVSFSRWTASAPTYKPTKKKTQSKSKHLGAKAVEGLEHLCRHRTWRHICMVPADHVFGHLVPSQCPPGRTDTCWHGGDYIYIYIYIYEKCIQYCPLNVTWYRSYM